MADGRPDVFFPEPALRALRRHLTQSLCRSALERERGVADSSRTGAGADRCGRGQVRSYTKRAGSMWNVGAHLGATVASRMHRGTWPVRIAAVAAESAPTQGVQGRWRQPQCGTRRTQSTRRWGRACSAPPSGIATGWGFSVASSALQQRLSRALRSLRRPTLLVSSACAECGASPNIS